MFGLPRCVALFTFAVVDGVDDRSENPGHYQKQMEGKQKDAENGRGVHHGHLSISQGSRHLRQWRSRTHRWSCCPGSLYSYTKEFLEGLSKYCRDFRDLDTVALRVNLGQHRTIASARFGESFLPPLRFEKLEIHAEFLRLSNLGLTKDLSPNCAMFP